MNECWQYTARDLSIFQVKVIVRGTISSKWNVLMCRPLAPHNTLFALKTAVEKYTSLLF